MKTRKKPELMEGGIIKPGTLFNMPTTDVPEKIIHLDDERFKITINGITSEEAIQELKEKMEKYKKWS